MPVNESWWLKFRRRLQTPVSKLIHRRRYHIAHYRGADLVRVVAARPNDRLEPEALNETNMLELYVFGSDKHHQAVLVARLDNLGKGASGAAAQNMRLMLGLADA